MNFFFRFPGTFQWLQWRFLLLVSGAVVGGCALSTSSFNTSAFEGASQPVSYEMPSVPYGQPGMQPTILTQNNAALQPVELSPSDTDTVALPSLPSASPNSNSNGLNGRVAPAGASSPWVSPKDMIQQLTQAETQLYGQTYPTDNQQARLERLEKTLFDTPQAGPVATRLQVVSKELTHIQGQREEASQEPVIAYLETRMFSEVYSQQPLYQRICQLETAIFGESKQHSAKNITLSERIQHLVYATPLHAKALRIQTTSGTNASRSPSGAARVNASRSSARLKKLNGRQPLSTLPTASSAREAAREAGRNGASTLTDQNNDASDSDNGSDTSYIPAYKNPGTRIDPNGLSSQSMPSPIRVHLNQGSMKLANPWVDPSAPASPPPAHMPSKALPVAGSKPLVLEEDDHRYSKNKR